MINYHVKNARTGRVVRTFSGPKLAVDFAKAHSGDALGDLQAFAVETIIRERLLTGEAETGTVRTLRPQRAS
jgi:hypothetical protein